MASKVVFGRLRNHVIGTGVVMAGWVVGSYLPNTWGAKFAKFYMKTKNQYCRDISVEPETEALLYQVIKDINAHQDTPVKKNRIEVIQTNEKEPYLYHKGNSSTGAFIWLPIGTRCNADDVFHYHFPDNISERMAKYCIFSQDAKKFIFAREIFYVEDSYVMFRLLLGLGLIAAGSIVHYFWNSVQDNLKQLKLRIQTIDSKGKKDINKLILELQLRALRQRCLTFVVIGFVFYQLYRLIDADYNWKLEREADEKVANLGPDYQRGGFEYYVKVTQLNKFLLSELRQRDKFDKEGNKIQSEYLVFQKHVPLASRYKYFGSLLSEDDIREAVNLPSS